MKLAFALSFVLLGLASGTSQVPTFTWLHRQFSPDGVPLLSINFHDGKPDDVAVLKQINPIPRQPKEREENIDNCIFGGFLQMETTVYVTLTGGCPFEDNFEIQFRSYRLKDHMFKVTNGVTVAVPSIYRTRGIVTDVALHPPKTAAKKVPAADKPANGYSMTVAMNYDPSFDAQFGDDGYNVMRRVAAHAENLYQHPTLINPIAWVVTGNLLIPDTIEADAEILEYVGKYNVDGPNSNVYMCFQNNEAGVVGIAWIDVVCGTPDYRTAIVEYFNNDLNSGEILAHEVGHNLGMLHDFDGSPGNPRYDSQGRTCTNIGGVMDYYGEVFQWSTCSVEDFEQSNHACLGAPDK